MKSFNKLRMVRKYLKPTLVPNRLRFTTGILLGIVAMASVLTLNAMDTSSNNTIEIETMTVQLDEATSTSQEPVNTDTIEDIREENNESVQSQPEYKEVQMFTTCSVNLRTNSSTDSESLTVIGNSELLTAQVVDNADWYYVEYNSMTGYVKSQYLKEYDPEIHLKDLGLEYQYQDLIRELIDLYGLDVDEYFFYGMMYTENRFQQEPESKAGAQGVFQVIPSTWKFCYNQFCEQYPDYTYLLVNDPTDKQSNIVIGMFYIKYLRDYYNYTSLSEHASQILTTYNRGPDSAKTYYDTYGTYSTEYSKEILRAADYIREHQTWKEGI